VSEASRAARAGDLPRLTELLEECRAELGPTRGGAVWLVRNPVTEADGERLTRRMAEMADGAALVLCGTIDDHVVGVASALVATLQDASRIAVIEDLYVEPDARSVGVGEAMMDAVLAWAANAGCRGIEAGVLPGNRAAKNFFERYGLTARAITVYRALP
jgi:GNAT superfamily N-acetyltransferase